MNEGHHIKKQFPDGFVGKFLALGEWPEVTGALIDAGWSGIVVDHRASDLGGVDGRTDVKHVHGPIGMAPHFIEVDRAYFMRCVTFREMLDTFPGPFNAILVSVPGLGKDLSTAEEMWVAWPRVICVRSEGREQEVANIAASHSYQPMRIERDAMILARPEGKTVK